MALRIAVSGIGREHWCAVAEARPRMDRSDSWCAHYEVAAASRNGVCLRDFGVRRRLDCGLPSGLKAISPAQVGVCRTDRALFPEERVCVRVASRVTPPRPTAPRPQRDPDAEWRARLAASPWITEWAAHLRCLAESYLKFERPELVEEALRLARRIESRRVEVPRREPPPRA